MEERLKGYYLLLKKYRIHFIAWFFFMFYEIVITGLLRGYFASIGNYAIFYFFNICLFYFHAHVIIPTAAARPKHAVWLFPVLVILEVVIYVPFTIYAIDFLQKYAGLSVFTPVVIDKISIGNGVWRSMYFIFFSSGYYYLMNYLKERKNVQLAEKARLLTIIEHQNVQAELIKSQHAHLKAQINPHFLFNTLSFIYSDTRKVAPEAAEAIMALSEMMRYAIQDDNERILTTLSQEIDQVENLIRLHQIKAENRLNIIFDCESGLEELEVIPLVLVTLVENVFKHGDLLQRAHPAQISICSDGNTIIIETENLINTKGTPTSHHIGLDNIKKRINMIYGDKASLETGKKSNNYFIATLRINLN